MGSKMGGSRMMRASKMGGAMPASKPSHMWGEWFRYQTSKSSILSVTLVNFWNLNKFVQNFKIENMSLEVGLIVFK